MSWVAASVVRRLHINQSWDMSWEEGILRENNNTQHTIQHDVWQSINQSITHNKITYYTRTTRLLCFV